MSEMRENWKALKGVRRCLTAAFVVCYTESFVLPGPASKSYSGPPLRPCDAFSSSENAVLRLQLVFERLHISVAFSAQACELSFLHLPIYLCTFSLGS